MKKDNINNFNIYNFNTMYDIMQRGRASKNVSASGFTLTMKIGEPVMTVNDVKKKLIPDAALRRL